MNNIPKQHILIAEDDLDDQLLLKLAFEGVFSAPTLHFVPDGEELIDYLLRKGKYKHEPRPALILLDLNMPRKSGYEVLQEIKVHPELRQIPVVVLSTSSHKVDIYKSYDLGANSFYSYPHCQDHEKAILSSVKHEAVGGLRQESGRLNSGADVHDYRTGSSHASRVGVQAHFHSISGKYPHI